MIDDTEHRWADGGPPTFSALLASVVMFAGVLGCGSLRSDWAEANERRQHGLDEACGESDDFTPGAVLDGLADEYTAPLYEPKRDAHTTLRLRPTYDGGRIECRPKSSDSPSRVAKLTIRIELGVETDDGAFREAIPAELSGYVHSDEFRVSGAIDASEIEGSYRPNDARGGEGDLLVEGWLGVDGRHSEGAIRRVGESSAGPSSDPTVGVWNRGRYVVTDPRRACAEEPGLTRREFSERLDRHHFGELDFEDRPTDTGLHLNVSAGDAPVVCEPAGSAANAAQLTTEVRVELRSGDGSLDESMRGSARLTDDGELVFVASTPVRELAGSFQPSEHVPAETAFVVRGSIPDGGSGRGSVRLETSEGENPLGVPELGTWHTGTESRGAPMN